MDGNCQHGLIISECGLCSDAFSKMKKRDGLEHDLRTTKAGLTDTVNKLQVCRDWIAGTVPETKANILLAKGSTLCAVPKDVILSQTKPHDSLKLKEKNPDCQRQKCTDRSRTTSSVLLMNAGELSGSWNLCVECAQAVEQHFKLNFPAANRGGQHARNKEH